MVRTIHTLVNPFHTDECLSSLPAFPHCCHKPGHSEHLHTCMLLCMCMLISVASVPQVMWTNHFPLLFLICLLCLLFSVFEEDRTSLCGIAVLRCSRSCWGFAEVSFFSSLHLLHYPPVPWLSVSWFSYPLLLSPKECDYFSLGSGLCTVKGIISLGGMLFFWKKTVNLIEHNTHRQSLRKQNKSTLSAN